MEWQAKTTDEGNVSESEEVGVQSQYPMVWLRDNCQCPLCFHESSHSRRMLMKDLDLDVAPDVVSAVS